MQRNKDILVVVDESERFLGVITPHSSRLVKALRNNKTQLSAGDLCNKNCKYVVSDGNYDHDLMLVRHIFADCYPKIGVVPVIDRDGNLVDLITRTRAFWKKCYEEGSLPRMHYANCIYGAAEMAKKLKYPSISVIEFGVAGGNGLVNCEFHAKEISRLSGVKIEIYGFDLGTGLPKPRQDGKDSTYIWPEGAFQMDIERLKNRLTSAKLVLGDIAETTLDFFDVWKPAPVGCILVDVDYYSSTLAILDFLKQDNEFFLPRICMYFDDIFPESECTGECLAVREFNAKNRDIQISPAGTADKGKICHRFTHELYGVTVRDKDADIPLECFV